MKIELKKPLPSETNPYLSDEGLLKPGLAPGAIDHDAVNESHRRRVATEEVKKRFNTLLSVLQGDRFCDYRNEIIDAMALEIAKLTHLYEPSQPQTREVEITGSDLFRRQLSKVAALMFKLRNNPEALKGYERFEEAMDALHGVLSQDDILVAFSELLLEALWPDDVPQPTGEEP